MGSDEQGSTREPFAASELEQNPALFVEHRRIRFQDVDAAGIVFFARVLEYFSDAYVGLLAARGFDLPHALEHDSLRAPYVHAEADYFAALRFGDAIEVAVVAAKLANSSFRLGYRINKADGGAIAAIGQSVHVFIEGSTPCAIPASFRALFAKS